MPERAYPGKPVRRLALWLCLAAAAVLLTGCLAVLDTFAPGAGKAPAAGADPSTGVGAAAGPVAPDARAATPLAKVPARPGPSDPRAPGYLYFVIADQQSRNAKGWRIQVTAAAAQQGFMPFLSTAMGAGMYLKAQLWPDRYQVRVLAQGPLYDAWVPVEPGAATVVHVDPSSGAISVLQGEAAEQVLAPLGQAARELRLRQTYQPLRIAMPAGLEGRYYGPREGNKPTGRGQLDLFQRQERVATVDEAAADEQGRFTGQPVFVDGRKVDGALGQDNGLEDGVTTEYQDGRIFKGRYEGVEPREGTMRYPDGTAWTGVFEQGEPVGEGSLRLADGTVILKAPQPDAAELDGVYECVMPNGRKGQCRYFEGERIVSSADYTRRVEGRRRARAAAEQAALPPPSSQQQTVEESQPRAPDAPAAASGAKPAAHPPAAAAPAPAPEQAPPQAPAMTQSGSGCGRVNGQYATSTGLSKLTFDGRGRGHMWQHTYGGARSYTFDIDFRYSGSHDSMRFEYEEGIYRDSGRNVLSRQKIPGGSASCSYDGHVLNIGGTKYFKQ